MINKTKRRIPVMQFFRKHNSGTPAIEFFGEPTSERRLDRSAEMEHNYLNMGGRGIRSSDYTDEEYFDNDFFRQRLTSIQFDSVFQSKAWRVRRYREMSKSAELSQCVDWVVNGAIVPDSNGEIAHLNPSQDVPKYVREYYEETWQYMIHDLLRFNDIGVDLFRRFVVESEIYILHIYETDEETGEKTDIIDYRVIPAYAALPIYQNDQIIKYVVGNIEKINSEVIDKFGANSPQNMAQYVIDYAINGRSRTNPRSFDIYEPEDITYVNWGNIGVSNIDVEGYLEDMIRPYNQMRMLIDSLVVYRVTRGTSRRVWNIVGPKGSQKRGMQMLQQVINKYKNVSTYDPKSGRMDSAKNHQSFQEDIWLLQEPGSDAHSVTNLDGQMNLGSLEDIHIISDQMYSAGKIPRNRWKNPESAQAAWGNGGDNTDEEENFARYNQQQAGKFRYLLKNLFMRILEVRGISSEWVSDRNYDIEFNKNNRFQEMRDQQTMDGLTDRITRGLQLLWSESNPTGAFAPEVFFIDVCGMRPDLYERNKVLIEESNAKLAEKKKKNRQSGAMDQQAMPGGDMGGGFDPFSGAAMGGVPGMDMGAVGGMGGDPMGGGMDMGAPGMGGMVDPMGGNSTLGNVGAVGADPTQISI